LIRCRALIVSISLISRLGFAQEPPPADLIDQAQRHFEAGDRYQLQADFGRALKEYERAYEISPHPRLIFNIAKMYELQGQLSDAFDWYQRYLRESNGGKDDEAYRHRAQVRARSLESTPARILVDCELPDAQGETAEVSITGDDGRTIQTTCKKEIAVRAGHYRIQIRAPHYDPGKVHDVSLHIGQPFNYFEPLKRKKGELRVFADPEEALVLVTDLNQRIYGDGTPNELPDGIHNLHVEAPGRIAEDRTIEVRSGQEALLNVPLRRQPRHGQLDLALFNAGYGGFVVPATVRAICVGCSPAQRELDPRTGLILSTGGAALGAFTSLFLTDEKMSTGTAYFIMAGPLYGSLEGLGIAMASDSNTENTLWWTLGGSAVGLTISALAAGPVDSTIGDSLLLHTGGFWGAATGFMLWGSIGAQRESDLGAFLLAGLNVGIVSGLVFSGETEYTWSHVAMINLGTAASTAIFLGLGAAIESNSGDQTQRWRFALGGMAVGFIASGLLTRNWDEPRYFRNLSIAPPMPMIDVGPDGTHRYMLSLVSGRW
jgi:hypothetical protein